MTKLDVKLKDLQDERIAEMVIGFANETFLQKLIEDVGEDEADRIMFTQGLRSSDPEITDVEVMEAHKSLSEEEKFEIAKYAKDRMFNSVIFLSVPGNDNKEVFFAALSRMENEDHISTQDWTLANAIAKDKSDDFFKDAGMKFGDLNIVYMDGDEVNGYKPIKVALDTDILNKK